MIGYIFLLYLVLASFGVVVAVVLNFLLLGVVVVSWLLVLFIRLWFMVFVLPCRFP
jgi:hypothetical protein